MIANLLKGAVEIKLLLIHIVAAQIFYSGLKMVDWLTNNSTVLVLEHV